MNKRHNEFDSFSSPNRRSSILPIVIAIVSVALLAIGVTVVMIFFNPFVNNSDKVLEDIAKETPEEKKVELVSDRRVWITEDGVEKADNRLWLENPGINVVSAKIYDDNGELIAEMKKNGETFTTDVEIPVNKVQDFLFYAKYDTDDSEDLETNYINLSVFDDIEHAELYSVAVTDKVCDLLKNNDEYNQLSYSQQAAAMEKELEKLYQNDPTKGEPFVKEGSIQYDEATHQVVFKGAANYNFHIGLRNSD